MGKPTRLRRNSCRNWWNKCDVSNCPFISTKTEEGPDRMQAKKTCDSDWMRTHVVSLALD